jgi:hypothetical protein
VWCRTNTHASGKTTVNDRRQSWSMFSGVLTSIGLLCNDPVTHHPVLSPSMCVCDMNSIVIGLFGKLLLAKKSRTSHEDSGVRQPKETLDPFDFVGVELIVCDVEHFHVLDQIE